MPRAGKRATTAYRRNTFNRCLAQENMQPLLVAVKHATGATRCKTKPVLRTDKHATSAKHGKTGSLFIADQNIAWVLGPKCWDPRLINLSHPLKKEAKEMLTVWYFFIIGSIIAGSEVFSCRLTSST